MLSRTLETRRLKKVLRCASTSSILLCWDSALHIRRNISRTKLLAQIFKRKNICYLIREVTSSVQWIPSFKAKAVTAVIIQKEDFTSSRSEQRFQCARAHCFMHVPQQKHSQIMYNYVLCLFTFREIDCGLCGKTLNVTCSRLWS